MWRMSLTLAAWDPVRKPNLGGWNVLKVELGGLDYRCRLREQLRSRLMPRTRHTPAPQPYAPPLQAGTDGRLDALQKEGEEGRKKITQSNWSASQPPDDDSRVRPNAANDDSNAYWVAV